MVLVVTSSANLNTTNMKGPGVGAAQLIKVLFVTVSINRAMGIYWTGVKISEGSWTQPVHVNRDIDITISPVQWLMRDVFYARTLGFHWEACLPNVGNVKLDTKGNKRKEVVHASSVQLTCIETGTCRPVSSALQVRTVSLGPRNVDNAPQEIALLYYHGTGLYGIL